MSVRTSLGGISQSSADELMPFGGGEPYLPPEDVMEIIRSIAHDEDICPEGFVLGVELPHHPDSDAEVKGNQQFHRRQGIHQHWEFGIEIHRFRQERKAHRAEADQLMTDTINAHLAEVVAARSQPVGKTLNQQMADEILDAPIEDIENVATNARRLIDTAVESGFPESEIPMLTLRDIQDATAKASVAARNLLKQRDKEYRAAKEDRRSIVHADVEAMTEAIPPLERDGGERHVHLEMFTEQHVDEIEGVPTTNDDGTPGLWPIKHPVYRWVTYREASDYDTLVPIVRSMVDESRTMRESKIDRVLVHGRTLDDQVSAFRAKK